MGCYNLWRRYDVTNFDIPEKLRKPSVHRIRKEISKYFKYFILLNRSKRVVLMIFGVKF